MKNVTQAASLVSRCQYYKVKSAIVMLSSKDTLRAISGHFKAPIRYSFGYGSGVFSQGVQSSAKARQIDMIFAVDNARAWHAKNLEQNYSHYSSVRYLGSSFVAWTQNRLGAGVYFNPYVKFGEHEVKYGVVELETLKRDLLQWDTLYLAGRMHKPVRVVQDLPEVADAQRTNLRSAMSTALLLLPPFFSELEFYTKIASVSYMGDVRMAFAEHPRKVENIVTNQFDLFRKLYMPLFPDLGINIEADADAMDGRGPLSRGLPLSQDARNDEKLVANLPTRFKEMITKGALVSERKQRVSRVSAAVASTIKWPSFTQSFKGLLSAGIARSAAYSAAKLGKRFAN